MARVFVSYAHSSSGHRQTVRQFADALRAAGLDVRIDSDVKSPAGPPEQWPRWMKKQIAEADWILLYIDATYRRRFDGNEEPGQGLGGTWEGCIVTHELYQAASKNNRFIPVLSDGTDPGLIPTEIVGATRYFVPSQQNELAQAIRNYAAGSGSTAVVTETTTADPPAAVESMDEWRQETVARFADAFFKLRSADRRAAVASVVGFAVDLDREPLYEFLDQFMRRYAFVESFDVEAISMIVAEFDALREDAVGQTQDLVVLTELQDLLLPLCIHPKIKAEVARQMEQHGGAIINEAVALAIGAELSAAPADRRQARFRLDDAGQIAGAGLLRFIDAAIGDPHPDELVCQILHDLASQLSVSLDEEIEDEPDVRKRIAGWSKELQLQVKAYRKRKKQRFYCVLKPPTNAVMKNRLIELLAQVRTEVPEIAFFELHRRSPTKAAEEIVMQILKDRLKHEAQA